MTSTAPQPSAPAALTAGERAAAGRDLPGALTRLLPELERRERIRTWPLPEGLPARALAPWPGLTPAQHARVEAGLRQYLLAAYAAAAPRKPAEGGAAMPSVLVDALWHEFILLTREYERFCRATYGRYLHHTPTEFMPAAQRTASQVRGLLRSYEVACGEQRLPAYSGRDLPVLFGVDAELGPAVGLQVHVEHLPTCAHLQPPVAAPPPPSGLLGRLGRRRTASPPPQPCAASATQVCLDHLRQGLPQASSGGCGGSGCSGCGGGCG